MNRCFRNLLFKKLINLSNTSNFISKNQFYSNHRVLSTIDKYYFFDKNLKYVNKNFDQKRLLSRVSNNKKNKKGEQDQIKKNYFKNIPAKKDSKTLEDLVKPVEIAPNQDSSDNIGVELCGELDKSFLNFF